MKKKKNIVIGALVVTALIITAVAGNRLRKPKAIYRLTKVFRGEVKMTILSTGTVAPENRIDLKAPVGGRIERVLVEEGQKVKGGQILAWMSSTERAALIDTATARGADELKYWEDSYRMTPILAPMRGGVIILKSADAGQTVTQTDTVLSLSDRLIVKATVDETDLAQVKLGQRVKLILDAFPENPLDAKVYHIGYDAKTVNNVTTYEVDVLADKVPPFMKSGMTANVTFQIDQRDDALLVPAAAIHRERRKSYVMVPNPDAGGEPVQKEVKVGISDGKRVEIVSGLDEGESVLTAAMRSLSKQQDEKMNSPFGSNYGGGRR